MKGSNKDGHHKKQDEERRGADQVANPEIVKAVIKAAQGAEDRPQGEVMTLAKLSRVVG